MQGKTTGNEKRIELPEIDRGNAHGRQRIDAWERRHLAGVILFLGCERKN
jgi:hypothetical protein